MPQVLRDPLRRCPWGLTVPEYTAALDAVDGRLDALLSSVVSEGLAADTEAAAALLVSEGEAFARQWVLGSYVPNAVLATWLGGTITAMTAAAARGQGNPVTPPIGPADVALAVEVLLLRRAGTYETDEERAARTPRYRRGW